MESIRLTIELPAGLATALTGFLENLKVVAVEKEINKTTVGGGVVGVVEVIDPPADVNEVLDYCRDNELVANGRRFYNYYKDRGWRDTNGNPLTNWHERLLMWDEEDRRKNPQLKPAKRNQNNDDTERIKRILGVKDDDSDDPGKPDN